MSFTTSPDPAVTTDPVAPVEPAEEPAEEPAAEPVDPVRAALDELVAFKDELLRLTGSLSQEHMAALEDVVTRVVEAVRGKPEAPAAE